MAIYHWVGEQYLTEDQKVVVRDDRYNKLPVNCTGRRLYQLQPHSNYLCYVAFPFMIFRGIVEGIYDRQCALIENGIIFRTSYIFNECYEWYYRNFNKYHAEDLIDNVRSLAKHFIEVVETEENGKTTYEIKPLDLFRRIKELSGGTIDIEDFTYNANNYPYIEYDELRYALLAMDKIEVALDISMDKGNKSYKNNWGTGYDNIFDCIDKTDKSLTITEDSTYYNGYERAFVFYSNSSKKYYYEQYGGNARFHFENNRSYWQDYYNELPTQSVDFYYFYTFEKNRAKKNYYNDKYELGELIKLGSTVTTDSYGDQTYTSDYTELCNGQNKYLPYKMIYKGCRIYQEDVRAVISLEFGDIPEDNCDTTIYKWSIYSTVNIKLNNNLYMRYEAHNFLPYMPTQDLPSGVCRTYTDIEYIHDIDYYTKVIYRYDIDTSNLTDFVIHCELCEASSGGVINLLGNCYELKSQENNLHLLTGNLQCPFINIPSTYYTKYNIWQYCLESL